MFLGFNAYRVQIPFSLWTSSFHEKRVRSSFIFFLKLCRQDLNSFEFPSPSPGFNTPGYNHPSGSPHHHKYECPLQLSFDADWFYDTSASHPHVGAGFSGQQRQQQERSYGGYPGQQYQQQYNSPSNPPPGYRGSGGHHYASRA